MDAKTLGWRIAQARNAAKLSQGELGERIGVTGPSAHSTISKIEGGSRKVAAVEMFAIARALDRPLQWFVMDESPAVISRRTDVDFDESVATQIDSDIELLADDVRSLMRRGLIAGGDLPNWGRLQSHDDAERIAHEVRRQLNAGHDPIHDIVGAAESLGMFTLISDYPSGDGAQVRVEHDDSYAAVALINGKQEEWRKRMTVAHELAHWLTGDAYDAHSGDSENLVKSVAIHLLVPREGVQLIFADAPHRSNRVKAVRVAGTYRVSWTAAVGQLRNLGLIDAAERERLAADLPMKSEFVSAGVQRKPDELIAPQMSPTLQQAIVTGYESSKLTRKRALRILRGALTDAELAMRDDSPFTVVES